MCECECVCGRSALPHPLSLCLRCRVTRGVSHHDSSSAWKRHQGGELSLFPSPTLTTHSSLESLQPRYNRSHISCLFFFFFFFPVLSFCLQPCSICTKWPICEYHAYILSEHFVSKPSVLIKSLFLYIIIYMYAENYISVSFVRCKLPLNCHRLSWSKVSKRRCTLPNRLYWEYWGVTTHNIR